MELDLCQSFAGDDYDCTERLMYPTIPIKTEKPVWVEEELTYTDLSSFSLKAFPAERHPHSTTTDLRRWTQRHPEHWTPTEVLDWIYFVADQRGLDAVRGESFQNVCGLELCRMNLTGFIMRDPDNGSILHDVFRGLMDNEKFVAPPPDVFKQAEEANVPEFNHLLGEDHSDMSDILDNNLRLVPDGNGGMQVALNGEWYPIDFSCSMEPESMDLDPGYVSDSNSDSSVRNSSCSSTSDIFPDMETPKHIAPTTTPKRRTKSSHLSTSSLSTEDGSDTGGDVKKSNRGRKSGQLSKGNHLWEFIRDLLKTQSYNPTLLKWEDKENGVFRFVQSEAVAQMWGRKKNNPGMTYEKLSRAMRFCRTAGYFAAVPKNGKFPKKLCFRFGPKAFDWKSE